MMRCLALAQAWRDAGGRAVFASAVTTNAIQSRLDAESCEIATVSGAPGSEDDAHATITRAAREGARWVVVDGYHFGHEYQKRLTEAGCKVLFLDDYGHAGEYPADLVLNQNVTADPVLYSKRASRTRLLLGPQYALLRREFNRWRAWERSIPAVCVRLLVTMGGSDPEDLTSRVIQALLLAGLNELAVTILVGGSNPNFSRLQEQAKAANVRAEFLRDVSDIGSVMAGADAAVSAAGTTCHELCLLGLPALLVDVSDNQNPIARELDRRECAIHIGGRHIAPDKLSEGIKLLIGSQHLRASLSNHARQIVDGRGAHRIVSVLCGVEGLRLREVTADDERLLWEWVNDPQVREASFSQAFIPWEDHVVWFRKKICDLRTLMQIVVDETDSPVGQVRFEIEGSDAVINISLAKDARGRGLGVAAIDVATRELFAARICERVHAYVRPGNNASSNAFRKAGFTELERATVRGCAALHFVRGPH